MDSGVRIQYFVKLAFTIFKGIKKKKWRYINDPYLERLRGTSR